MQRKFTIIIQKDEDWYIASCPQVTGANGKGRTVAALKDIESAIKLILKDRRDDGPDDDGPAPLSVA
jgi:predicted RNase H-like HicB family nuclease